jgi:hypothetical protein
MRIDPALAGAEVDGAVRAAVAAAVGRSLRAFEEDVLDARGGFARPGFQAPAFTWGGRPVAAEWRQAIEQACAEEIAALTRPIEERVADRLRRAPRVMPPDPYERIDPLRFDGDTYFVPSYDGDTPSPDVALYFDSFEEAVERTPRGYHADWWEWDGSNANALKGAIFRTLYLKYGFSGIPSTTGVIFWNRASGGLTIVFLFGVRTSGRDASDPAAQMSWSSVSSIDLGDVATRLDQNNSVSRGAVGFRPFGRVWLELLRTVQTTEDIERAIFEQFLADRGISIAPAAGEPPATTTTRNLVRQFAADTAPNYRPPAGAMYAIRGSGASGMRHVPTGVRVETGVDIIPIGAFQVGEIPRSDEEEEGHSATRLRTGEGEGDGAGEGGGEGDGGRAGGGATGGEPGGTGTGGGIEGEEGGLRGTATEFHYPRSYGSTSIELDLGPFRGEPSLDQLGALGDRMRRLIQRIAFRLDMPEGQYCGAFLIAAAQVMGGHASGIADLGESDAEATRVVRDGTGNLGYMEMQPEITPTVQLMRYLGGTCPPISELTELMSAVYQLPDIRRLITGMRHDDAIGWLLDFYREHTPAMRGAVSWTYRRTCQLMMLQLLRSSRTEIQRRLTSFDDYFPIAEALITRLLSGEAQLTHMRQMLLTVQSFTSPAAELSLAVSSWRDARRALTTTLSGRLLNVASVTSPGRLFETHGTLERDGDVWKVRDADGRLWTMAEIEREIALRHQMAQSIDPLILQFVDIPAVVATFRDSPLLARGYLYSLLSEMLANNVDIESRTRSDNMFAFRSGAITESLPDRTVPGTSVAMRGIHLLAHDAIGESFRGNYWYAEGLNQAFNVELGMRSLTSFFETAGTLVLSVLCPPLGIALGIGIAASHYHDATIKEELYGSLIDPEVLMSRSEVEFEMFMAQFELALSIIPDIGTIMRGGSRLANVGARAGMRGVLTTVRRELLVAIGQQVRRGLVRAFVETVLIDRVMTLVLPLVLTPVMEGVNREISILVGEAVGPDPAAAGGASTASDAAPATTADEADLMRRIEEYLQGKPTDDLPPASEAP